MAPTCPYFMRALKHSWFGRSSPTNQTYVHEHGSSLTMFQMVPIVMRFEFNSIFKKKWKSGHKRRLLSVCLSFLLIIFTTLCFTILLFSFFIYFFLVWKERSFCIDLRLLYSWDLPHKQFFILNKFIFKKTFALLIVFDELSLIRLHHFKFKICHTTELKY